MDLKEESLVADARRHWYYRSKTAAMLRLLDGRMPAEVLDVGAGSGFFSRALLRETGCARAVCVDPGYNAERDETEAGKPIAFRQQIRASAADLVLMMDVLEHVPDDSGLVGEYKARVRAGTRFMVTVPAFQWMWSGHDVLLDHFRRYTLRQIEAAVRGGGLRVERGCYFYGGVLPLAAATRLVGRVRGGAAKSQMRDVPGAVSAVLGGVCRVELGVMRYNRVGGLTACVVARKV